MFRRFSAMNHVSMTAAVRAEAVSSCAHSAMLNICLDAIILASIIILGMIRLCLPPAV